MAAARSGPSVSFPASAGELGRACAAALGFRSASAKPKGRGLAFAFRRAVSKPVTVDVFQSSRGRRVLADRRVARFTGRKAGFTWQGRRGLTDGIYFARFTIAGETRRVTLARVRGRFRARRPTMGASAAA